MQLRFPARLIRLACLALATSFAWPAQADMFTSLGNVFGREQDRIKTWARNPDDVFHWGDWDSIQALPRERDSEANQHPARLSVAEVTAALASVRVDRRGSRVELFSPDERERLAWAITLGLAAITPDQDLVFLITGRHTDVGPFSQKLSTTGRVFVSGGRLQLIIGSALTDALLNVPPGGRPRQAILSASRATPSAQARLVDDGRLVRADWIAFAPPSEPSPVARPQLVEAPAAPIAPAVPVPADRLATLERLHDQGLISDAEYKAKRKEAQVR